jgi:hypothetical protein
MAFMKKASSAAEKRLVGMIWIVYFVVVLQSLKKYKEDTSQGSTTLSVQLLRAV